jgi:23S rRNA pseudouridine2604 synthase
MEKITYPIRINRYLFLKGFCSRRKADKLIEEKKVFINGKVAPLGAKVSEKDTVTLAESIKKLPSTYKYFAYYKPKGIVSNNPQRDEKGVSDVSGLGKAFVAIGRLDKDSYGLMLLSNDGRIVDRALNPKYDHEKEYVVKVDKKINARFLHRMRTGVDIEGYTTKPADISKVNENTFRIVLTEGKKHQIRRMAMALGFQVVDLKRVRIMNIKLGSLKRGATREITGDERETLLSSLGF